MKEFIQHIENLLIKNDFVIIPDFGGFTFQNQSARVTPTGITPPLVKVGFNSLLKNNDGLLTVAIVRERDIRSKDANRVIEQNVAYIKSQLKRKKKFQFGRLGVFYSKQDGQLTFVPASNFDFLPMNFGLKKLEMKKREEKQPNIRFKTKELLQYAAIALLLFGIFLNAQQLGYTESENYASIENPLSFLSNVSLFSGLTLKSQNTNLIEEEPKEQAYHVVVASLRKLSSAQRYCDLLKSKHYSNAHVRSSGSNNQVVIESFSSAELATLYLKKHCSNDESMKDAWILYQSSSE